MAKKAAGNWGDDEIHKLFHKGKLIFYDFHFLTLSKQINSNFDLKSIYCPALPSTSRLAIADWNFPFPLCFEKLRLDAQFMRHTVVLKVKLVTPPLNPQRHLT